MPKFAGMVLGSPTNGAAIAIASLVTTNSSFTISSFCVAVTSLKRREAASPRLCAVRIATYVQTSIQPIINVES